MSVQEAQSELIKYAENEKLGYFSLDPIKHFLQLVLVTISVIRLDDTILCHILKFFNQHCKFDENFYLTFFQQRMKNLDFKILSLDNSKDKLNGYIYVNGLTWHKLSSDFFKSIAKHIFQTCKNRDSEELLTSIQSMGYSDNSAELKHVRSNFKRYENIFNFKNCKIKFNESIEISNFNHLDSATSDGCVNYSFDVQDYTKPTDMMFSLQNTDRYTAEYCAYMRTTYGKSPISGKLNVFNCIQFIYSQCFIATVFLKRKAMQRLCIYLGLPGSGKTELLKIFVSIFEGVSKRTCIENHFDDKELNSNKADSQEVYLYYTDESGTIKNKSSFLNEITDTHCSTNIRQLYAPSKQKGPDAQFCNASFAMCGNVGPKYYTDEPYLLDPAVLRRYFSLVHDNQIGDNSSFNSKNFYEHVCNFTLPTHGSPEYLKMRKGNLYYALDIARYFGIGTWCGNNNILPCALNFRRVVSNQFLPIQILREVFVFIDEIYPQDNREMKLFLKVSKLQP